MNFDEPEFLAPLGNTKVRMAMEELEPTRADPDLMESHDDAI